MAMSCSESSAFKSVTVRQKTNAELFILPPPAYTPALARGMPLGEPSTAGQHDVAREEWKVF